MLKKILITLLIVPVVGAAIYGYFHFKQIKTPLSPVIQAIPVNTALIVKCNTPKATLQQFSMNNAVWKTLMAYPFFGEMHEDIRFLDGLFENGSDALNYLQDKPLFISIHPDASHHYDVLYLINLPNTISKKQVNDFIKNATSQNALATMRIYDGVALNELKKTDGNSFYYYFNKGIFACTFSSYLIEESIRQLNSGTPISADPSFDKIWNSAGKKVEATLFINYANFTQTLSGAVAKKEADFLPVLSVFANWSSLDIKPKGNAYLLTGFSYSNDSSSNYLNLYKNQEAQEIELLEHIPSSAAYVHWTGLSDVNLFFKNYENYINNSPANYVRQTASTSFYKKFGINAANFFKQWMGNQFAYVITESNTNNYLQNCYAIIQTNGKKNAAELIDEYKKQTNKKTLNTDTLNETFRGYTISHLATSNLLPLVFGDAFAKLNDTYYVITKEAVIFGNSRSSLKKWMNAITAKHTLGEDEKYQKFADNISSQATLYVYSALARSPKLISSIFNPDVLNWDETKTASLRNFQGLAMQLSSDKNLFYSNAYISYQPGYTGAQEWLAETVLDSTLHQTPSFLTDPEDSSRYLFVQDDALKIYLIDKDGNVKWKKEMAEKIHGKAHALRSQKGKELQILFSTSTKIYLLDEAGNNVGKFPISLSFKASNAVSLVDYDANGEYRFLIAESNKRVYNYTHKGDPVNGWEAVPMNDVITAPIRNFRAKGLDYLVLLDQSGNVNLLDRKGKSIVKFKQKFNSLYANNYQLLVESTLNGSSIYALDSSGNSTRLYFSGKIEKSVLPVKGNYYNSIQTSGGIKNLLLSKTKASIYDASMEMLHEFKIPMQANYNPVFCYNSNKGFDFIMASFDKGLSILNSEGTEISSYSCEISCEPVVGQLYSDQSWYVAVGVGNKLRIYPAY
ncbi:MAG TPA: hypothetical protein PLN13_11445 [Bacteroidia bacterium]|nr:hypothetical protein [Bacteroidia bacterium]HRH09187.1 hypothetical protein [Bacteroidia bacterium]